MGYTVKQVAEMSGVSVRTLHFYDVALFDAHGMVLLGPPLGWER